MAGNKPKKATKSHIRPTPSAVLQGQLNINQELFCRYYTQDSDTFGNATRAYGFAYDYKLDELPDDDAVYETITDEKGHAHQELVEPSTKQKALSVCATEGNRLLRNPKVLTRITTLLNEMLTEEFVDAELLKVIRQDHDLGPKVRAISEFNKLRQRITDRLDLTSGGKTIAHLISQAHAQPGGGPQPTGAVQD